MDLLRRPRSAHAHLYYGRTYQYRPLQYLNIHQDCLETLRSKNDQLCRDNRLLTGDLERANRQIHDLQHQTRFLDYSYRTKEQQIHKEKRDNVMITLELKVLRRKLSNITNELENEKHHRKTNSLAEFWDACRTIQQLERKIEALRERIDQMHKFHTERYQDIFSEKHRISRNFEQAKRELLDSQRKNDTLRRDISDLSNKLKNEKQKRRTNSMDEFWGTCCRIEQLEHKLDELRKRIDLMHSLYTEQYRGRFKEETHITRLSEKAKRELKEVQGEHATLTADIRNVKRRYGSKLNECDDAKQNALRSHEDTFIRRLQNEISDAKQENIQVKERMRNEVKAVKDEMSKIILKKDEKIKELQNSIRFLQQSIDEYSKGENALQKNVRDADALGRETSYKTELKKELANQKIATESIQKRLKMIEDENLHMKASLVEEQRIVKSLRNDVQIKEETIQKLKFELQTLHTEYNAINHDSKLLADQTKENPDIAGKPEGLHQKEEQDQDVLQAKILSMKSDLDRLQQTCEQTAKEKEDILQSLTECNKRNNMIEEDKQRLVQQIQKKNEEIKELTNNVQDLNITVVRFKEEKLQLQIANDENLKRLCETEKTIQTMESSKDETRRLEETIRKMTSEISALKREREQLQRDKDDALTRLSKTAGAKLAQGNASIADLSDDHRPTKLAEKFSELYDNLWTDSYEELTSTNMEDKDTIANLLHILRMAYSFCSEREEMYDSSLKQATYCIPRQIPETVKNQDLPTNILVQKALFEIKKLVNAEDLLAEMFLEKIDDMEKSVIPNFQKGFFPKITLYARHCAKLCWLMRIRDPRVHMEFNFTKGALFDGDLLRQYTRSGSTIDYLVWPVLYLHEDGPVLCKGVAQPE